MKQKLGSVFFKVSYILYQVYRNIGQDGKNSSLLCVSMTIWKHMMLNLARKDTTWSLFSLDLICPSIRQITKRSQRKKRGDWCGFLKDTITKLTRQISNREILYKLIFCGPS